MAHVFDGESGESEKSFAFKVKPSPIVIIDMILANPNIPSIFTFLDMRKIPTVKISLKDTRIKYKIFMVLHETYSYMI